MPLTIGWREISARLALTILAGALIGWNRGETGHPAGMRTTILVCLAASISMIEANLLLDTRGKTPDAFAVLDLARFPLGILSGMGFIGAGAILHRGSLVEGVTTAATLWFVTMVGLCFGGGLPGIGVVATTIGFFVLTVLKRAEDYLPVDRRATIDLTAECDSPVAATLPAELVQQGYRVVERGAATQVADGRRHVLYEVYWRAPPGQPGLGECLDKFAAGPGMIELAWQLGPLPDRDTTRPPIP
ncbi:MAG TPA: MgtC/SapB family protein [Stellaceae bacterium]|jgi:putative Mg2+ transporter-C (MgtC) family protein|nr:MgtC/SapB family protein [Stellaceae bacterium]